MHRFAGQAQKSLDRIAGVIEKRITASFRTQSKERDSRSGHTIDSNRVAARRGLLLKQTSPYPDPDFLCSYRGWKPRAENKVSFRLPQVMRAVLSVEYYFTHHIISTILFLSENEIQPFGLA
jgi:hypothetical protein